MSSPPFGELAALSAAFLWAIASMLFASLGKDHALSPLVMNLLKCTLAGTLLWLTMRATQGVWWPHALDSQTLGILGASGLIGLTLGDTSYFRALVHLGARKGLLLMTLSPVITATLAWPILHEPITPTMALGMTITLAGIIWVILERSPPPPTDQAAPPAPAAPQGLRLGVALGVLAALCQATGNVLTKLGSQVQALSSVEVSVIRLVFGGAGLALIVGLWPTLWAGVGRIFCSWRLASRLILATVLGTYLGIWLLVTALQLSPAGVAATLSSLSPIFVLPLVALIQKEPISPRALAGALVAVVGVAILSF